MKKQILSSALLVLILVVLIIPCASVPAYAATGNGRIYGKLLNGTNKNAPLPGQTVTLQLAQGTNAQDAARATTDAQGSFSFAKLATDKTISYAVYISYQGAQYVSNVVTLDSKPQQQVNLTVYQATKSTANLAVVQATVLVQEPNLARGTITISEIYDFKNLDIRAYVGSLDASKGKPDALLFSLPLKARNITLSEGFNGYQVIQVDRGFATNAAVPPGDSEFAFAYDVPYSSSNYNLSYTTMYPTVSLTMLVPPDIQVTSKDVSSQGLVTANQHAYRSYKANILPAGRNLQVGLSGMATPQSAKPPAPINAMIVWLVVAALLMLAVLFVTVFLYRGRSRRARAKQKQSRAQAAHKGSQDSSSKTTTRPVETEQHTSARTDQQKALLQQILELDQAYEAGKLRKAAYQEKRGRLKARLRTLMNEQRETARK